MYGAMELRQLEYFAAVARHGHFTRASEELNVAQPAVSQQIKRLEAELGIQLFHRSTRSVELTEAGRTLLARANRVLAEIEAARQEVSEFAGLLRGTVEIGTIPVSSLDTPGLLEAFREVHPGIGLHLHEQSLGVLMPMLRGDRLDLCFALADPADFDDDIDGVVLFHEELVVVMAEDHPLAGRSWLKLASIADEALIRFRSGSALQGAIDTEFQRAGATPQFAFETLELEMMRALASRGLGVALLPSGYLLREGPPVASVPLRPRIHLPVSLLWRVDRKLPPAAQAFLDLALRQLVG
jgi:DNA-binding transcriptional LysR family regulator